MTPMQWRALRFHRWVKASIRRWRGRPAKDPSYEMAIEVGRDGVAKLTYSWTHQTRNEATAHLVLEALRLVKPRLRKGGFVFFDTGDRAPKPRKGRMLSFAIEPDSRNVIPAPDFSFWNWPDVGIADYTATVAEIVEAGRKPPVDDGLFWIGNLEMSPIRRVLVEIAKSDRRILAGAVDWIYTDEPVVRAEDAQLQTRAGNYVSLPDHCRFRYLIDVEGYGFSGRLKFLLHSGRPLFLQDRPYREYFYKDLRPFEHFIPVRRDLTDLSERLDWAEAHPDECAAIANNARDFAMANLTREAAIERMAAAILEAMES